MKKFNKTPLMLAMGTAVISSFAINAQAESNPFAMSELSNGYMLADAAGKASNGACGGNVADANGNKITPAKKGSKTENGAKTKKAEGSCGEGMCGGMMQDGKMKKGMEMSCGEMMKGKEGSCGMMGDMKGMEHDDKANAGNAKSEEGSCGGMMGGMGDMKGMEHGDKADTGNAKSEEGSCGSMMKGGEGSCGSKVDADKAAGE
jgi:uncharacterized low-complexity protein